MKTKYIKLSELRPADYNPRKTLQPGDEEYEALKNSLDRFGVAEPLIMNERTGNLVSGHQRLNALKEMGAEEVEVVLIDMEEDEEKLLNIALNKIEGDWDYMKLRELFEEFDDEDIKFTGFSEDEVAALFDEEIEDLEEEQKAAEEKEGKQADEKEKEFQVFLSFPTKEAAEAWLEEREIGARFTGTLRNITIQMEGDEYGTGY